MLIDEVYKNIYNITNYDVMEYLRSSPIMDSYEQCLYVESLRHEITVKCLEHSLVITVIPIACTKAQLITFTECMQLWQKLDPII